MDYNFSARISSLQPSAIREILKAASDPSTISFAAGNPSPESFPVEEIKKITASILAETPDAALQYGITEGFQPLLDAVLKRMGRRFGCGRDFDGLMSVSGAQQGIELSCKVLCNEGDTVICENPSFIGALNAFRSYKVKLCGVDVEDDGINVEMLEKALSEQKNVKLIYLIPTFQNPTGGTMSLKKRKEVYALAKKYGVMILEDSPYVDLRFAGEEVPCIKSFDEDGIVIYCGTFSKILSAGLRVGYVLAPKPVLQKMVVAKQVSDVHTSMLSQMIAYRFMTEYDLEAHILKIRSIYLRKSSLMLDCAAKYSPWLKIKRPDGGLFLWCSLPEGCDMLDYCKRAAGSGVSVVPGSAFLADETAACGAFRLNFSTPSDAQIEKGMELLGRIKI